MTNITTTIKGMNIYPIFIKMIKMVILALIIMSHIN